jgi:hypothetical protein
MSAIRTRKTLADYVAIAISPLLIMALVGSLVFFLVAVLYTGEFASRLCWILFFFVFGAVLIARMTMQGDVADRAGLYGLVLGLLTWIALLLYVDWRNSGGLAPFGWLIDIGLIGIIWWCAHRLTWDCTLIDDDVDASGAGLLQVAGLEGNTGAAATESEPEAPAGRGKREPKTLSGLAGWIDRYQRYKEERKKRPHTPGVWVVYFSLAALPVFGLGQALLAKNPRRSSADLAKLHQYTFWLMTIYVGSGLGLLLTTSFLGLRRYLRQRKLQMPVSMTGVWLTVGGMLIAAFLFVGALLPRPDSAQPLVEWVAALTSPDRDASEHDQLGEEPGEGEGREGNEKARDAAQEKDGAARDKEGEAKDKKPEKDGKTSGKKGQGDDKDGGSSQKDARGKDGKESSQKRPKEETNERDKGSGGKEKANDKKPKAKEEKRKEENGSGPRKAQQTPPSHPPSTFPDFIKPIANVVKWIVAGIVAAVVLFLVLKNGLKFLANFTIWARKLLASFRAAWQALVAWLRGRSGASATIETAEEEARATPFAIFHDPFESGAVDRMTNEQMVRYSFDAFQAWARERDLPRQTGETPLEFARRIGEDVPALDLPGRKLTNFYAQIAYARGSPGKACREPLRQFWQVLSEVVEKPMSAGIGGE